MPRATSDLPVTVHRYGTPSWIELPDIVIVQLRLAHRLRNTLVELAHQQDEERAKIYATVPQVAEVQERWTAADTTRHECEEAVTKLKIERRTRRPTGPETLALRDAKAASTALKRELIAVKAEVKPIIKPQLEALALRYKASIKATYVTYVQTPYVDDEGTQWPGLYWAVWNDVCDHHRTAEQRVIKLRQEGRAAQQRFRGFRGAGALAVQLQRGADEPPRTPGVIADEKARYKNVLRFGTWMDPEEFGKLSRAEQRRRAQTTIGVRIGGELVEVPAVMHRMLPSDADITSARLVVRRVGPDTRVAITVAARVAKPLPREGGPWVAVHCGWRREEDDSIRVATWRASEPVAVPPSLRDIVQMTGPSSGIVVLPASWRDGLARPDVLRSERDTALDALRAELMTWLEAHPQPGDEPVTAGMVKAWRSPRRFARLTREWTSTPPPESAQILATMQVWATRDTNTWRRQEHGRDKALGRRTDGWRRVAAWVAGFAGRVVVDDTNLAELTRAITQKANDDTVPKEVTQIAARQRVDAAPGDLRAQVLAAAKRDGVPTTTVSGVNLSREHTCGWVSTEEVATRPAHCLGCGRSYDPDLSATLILLTRAEIKCAEEVAQAEKDAAEAAEPVA